jgi:hypothetical protein
MPLIYNGYRGCHTPATHRALVAPPPRPEKVSRRKRTGGVNRYSPAEDAQIIRLRDEDKQTFVAIALAMSRPESSVWYRYSLLKARAA